MSKENPSPQSPNSRSEKTDVEKFLKSGEFTAKFKKKIQSLSEEQRQKIMDAFTQIVDTDPRQAKITALRASVNDILRNRSPFELPGDGGTLLSFAELGKLLGELIELGEDVGAEKQKAMEKFLRSARKLLRKGAHFKAIFNNKTQHLFIVDDPVVDDIGVLTCSVTEVSLNDSSEPRADVKTDGMESFELDLVAHPAPSLLVFKQYGYK